MRRILFILGFSVFLVLLFATLSYNQNTLPDNIKTKAEYHDYLAKLRGDETSLLKPSGAEDRKRSILNVGNVEARIRNSATLGYDRDGKCYEFPAGSGISYRWTMAPLVGYKKTDGTPVVSSGAYGAQRGHEDEFEPISGLDAGWSDSPANNYGIAASDRPDTWPAAWPTDEYMPPIGEKGFPGILNGQPVATRELYFAVTDESNNVSPGNIRVDLWAIQYEDFINEDFIIFRMIVTNISDETMHDVYVGMHDDPDTPEQGDAEWTDDFAAFIPVGSDVEGYAGDQDTLLWNLAYLWDGDDRVEGLIASKVGWVGLKVLETPEDPNNPGTPLGLTTLDVFEYSNAPQTEFAEYEQLASGIKPPDNVEPHPDDWTQSPNTYGPDITYVFASGPFELAPGEQLNFALASVHGVNKKDLFNNAMLCQVLYNSEYRAAEAPPEPNLRAIAGDHTVTLYWDPYPTEDGVYYNANGEIDHVGDKLTGNNAFEGYKVYKSIDRGITWGEAMIDVSGAPRGYIPLAQYDIPNGITGESETRPFFYLGDDTGLKHSYTDNNVENGYEYWYAVIAYDSDDGPIPPLQNAFKKDADLPHDNVVAVVPKGIVSGFQEGAVDSAIHIEGNCDIDSYPVEVVDPTALTGDNYEITFSITDDGKTFTITNTTESTIPMAGFLPVENWPFYDADLDNAPIFDGVRLIITDIEYGAKEISGSSENYGINYMLEYFDYYELPPEVDHDYEIEFTSETYEIYSIWRIAGYDEPNSTVNFKLTDLTTGKQICPIWEDDGDYNLVYDNGENIFFNHQEYGVQPDDYSGYGFILTVDTALTDPNPEIGDKITIITNKTITANDKYTFSTTAGSYSQVNKKDLSQITTVPNPFVVSSVYEIGAFGTEKEVQFHFLPPQCTIKIFNIAGDLIRTIEHTNGTSIEKWNLQSYNQQEVAFGVYIYHIDAPGIGEHIGKMAVIK
ncbi:MAG: hypothetical protein ACFFD4_37395 [Candidatus Odinarchaeota archaeon]